MEPAAAACHIIRCRTVFRRQTCMSQPQGKQGLHEPEDVGMMCQREYKPKKMVQKRIFLGALQGDSKSEGSRERASVKTCATKAIRRTLTKISNLWKRFEALQTAWSPQRSHRSAPVLQNLSKSRSDFPDDLMDCKPTRSRREEGWEECVSCTSDRFKMVREEKGVYAEKTRARLLSLPGSRVLFPGLYSCIINT